MKLTPIKRSVVAVSIALLVTATVAIPVSAAPPLPPLQVLDQPRKALVEALAKAYLSLHNEQLVDANSATAAVALPSGLEAPLVARVSGNLAELRASKQRLADAGERYSRYETSTHMIAMTSTGRKTVARIEERTRFDYVKVHGDEPEFTDFRVERDFTFVRSNGKWKLSDVQLVPNEGPVPINEVIPAQSVSPAVAPNKMSSDTSRLSGPLNVAAKESKMQDGEVTAQASYNYNAMADYVIKWAYKPYNPAYIQLENDCTNFISQALRAGGWTDVQGLSVRSNNAWWYTPGVNYSFIWSAAENWYWFATGSGRTYTLNNIWQMLLADVLQADWNRDGNINHTMMVSYVGTSDLYLAYHTADYRYRSLTSLLEKYPNAWWYAHRT